MKTKLAHIYGESGANTQDITALTTRVTTLETKTKNLETKTTNLGNITAKTNIANVFTANQEVRGVITQTQAATQDNHLTRKADVLNLIGSWVQLQQWSGNFKTTTLVWTKTAQFSTAGIYEFRIVIKHNTKFYNAQFILKLDDVTNSVFSPVFWFNWNNDNATAIQNIPTSGFYMVYTNKQIKIIKVGQNQPETGTEMIIYYRGVR